MRRVNVVLCFVAWLTLSWSCFAGEADVARALKRATDAHKAQIGQPMVTEQVEASTAPPAQYAKAAACSCSKDCQCGCQWGQPCRCKVVDVDRDMMETLTWPLDGKREVEATPVCFGGRQRAFSAGVAVGACSPPPAVTYCPGVQYVPPVQYVPQVQYVPPAQYLPQMTWQVAAPPVATYYYPSYAAPAYAGAYQARGYGGGFSAGLSFGGACVGGR